MEKSGQYCIVRINVRGDHKKYEYIKGKMSKEYAALVAAAMCSFEYHYKVLTQRKYDASQQ